MRTRSSSNLVGNSSSNPTTSNPKRRNRRRSNQIVEPFTLEESPVVWICQKSQEISQKRTRERMSDQEAKEIKAEAREIMPQPSTKSTAASTVNLQSQHHSL
ncbi:hypothetical protein Tco_0120197 [Tanacetum coccineum]